MIKSRHWKFVRSTPGPIYQPLTTLCTAFPGLPATQVLPLLSFSASTLLLIPRQMEIQNQLVPSKQHSKNKRASVTLSL